MSTPTSRRVRRPGRAAAIGAVALTAAVALPAFASNRGGEEPVPAAAVTPVEDLARVAAANAVATQREAALDPYFEVAQAQAEVDGIVTAIGQMSPEDQFNLRWQSMSDGERTQTIEYFQALDAQKAEQEQRDAAARYAAALGAAQAREARQSAAPVASVSGGSVWDRLAECESGGNWHVNSGNGFSGGLQFVRSTWLSAGGGAYAPDAYLASREQQIAVAERVLASGGWSQWPACSRKLGLR